MAKKKRLDLILGAKDRATSVLGKVSGAIGGFVRKVGALAAPLAAVLSVAGIARFSQRSIQAFFEQEQAVENLRTALINAGDAGASSLAGMQQFASGLQAITTQGDEATLALAAKIATLGELSGEALQSATTATLGLARATGQGADMMGRAYLNALEGNFSMLERYVPALRAAEGETEKMALVQKLASNGLKLMQNDAGTARGRLQQMKNAVGDLMEVIGGQLAPVLGQVASGIQAFAENNADRIGTMVSGIVGFVQRGVAAVMPLVGRVRDVIGDFMNWYMENVWPVAFAYAGMVRQAVVTIIDIVGSAVRSVINAIGSLIGPLGGVGNAVTTVRDTVQAGLIAMEFGFANWRELIELATLKAGLAVVTFAGQVKHFFSEVIPGVVRWLADNWQTILTDLFNFTRTVMSNLASNVVKTIKSLPALLSGETSLGEIWGDALVKGFEAKLSTLPEIAGRQQGELERTLRQQVGSMEDDLGEGFGDFMQRRLDEINQQRDGLRDFFTGGDGAGGGRPAPLDPEDLLKPGGVTVPVKIDEGGAVSAGAAAAAGGAAGRRQVGISSVALSQRFQGLGLAGEDPGKTTAQNTGSMVGLMSRLLQQVTEQTKEIKEGRGERGQVLPIRRLGTS